MADNACTAPAAGTANALTGRPEWPAWIERKRIDDALTAEAYEKAYNRSGSRECLRSLYWIEKLDSRIALGERFRAVITQEERNAWEEQFLAAREKAAQSDQVKQVETWFCNGAEDGEKAARKLVETWKSEYRAMI